MSDYQQNLAKVLQEGFESKPFSDRDTNGQRIKELFGLNATFTPDERNYKNYEEYKRGDVVFVSNEAFDTCNGIQTKSRPGVIIQNNTGNFYSGNVIVAYLTGQIKKEDLPTHHVFKDSGCLKLSMVMTEQIQTVEKRYTKYIGKIDNKDLEALNQALAVSIGLDTFIEEQVEKALKLRQKDLITFKDANVPEEELVTQPEPVVQEIKAPISLGSLLKIQSLEGKDFTYTFGDKSLSIENKKDGCLIEFKAGDIDALDNFTKELEEFKEYYKSQQ